jgi:hypothetical protein
VASEFGFEPAEKCRGFAEELNVNIDVWRWSGSGRNVGHKSEDKKIRAMLR